MLFKYITFIQILSEMHERNFIDSMTPVNKELLGLENNNAEQTNTDKFANDYKEINEIISELINEVYKYNIE
jgi:hypothetical protein